MRESLPWKQAGDDSPQDGSRCDTATTHREQSVPAQMTLTTYEESKPTASVHETDGLVQPARTEGSGDDD